MVAPVKFGRYVFLVELVNPANPDQALAVDPIVKNVLAQTTIEHYHVHSGLHFVLDDYDGEVNIAAPKYWHLVAPDTNTEIHVYFSGSASNPGLFEIFEEPTVTADGVGLERVNNYRDFGRVSELGAFKDPTVADDGTRLAVGLIGGGTGIGRIGGTSSRPDELILKRGTAYLIKFTPSQNDTKVTINLSWYEVEEE